MKKSKIINNQKKQKRRKTKDKQQNFSMKCKITKILRALPKTNKQKINKMNSNTEAKKSKVCGYTKQGQITF